MAMLSNSDRQDRFSDLRTRRRLHRSSSPHKYKPASILDETSNKQRNKQKGDKLRQSKKSDDNLKFPDINKRNRRNVTNPSSDESDGGIWDGKYRKVEGDIRYNDYPILRRIQNSVIGHNQVISTPYGPRQAVYCDYTSSGRCLSFIEDYIRDTVLPVYNNTLSASGGGFTARQTKQFREDSRAIIKRCVNAKKEDAVIFTGSDVTSGIHKVAWALRINQPRVANETVVFVGPYEHHSNIVPWREYGTYPARRYAAVIALNAWIDQMFQTLIMDCEAFSDQKPENLHLRHEVSHIRQEQDTGLVDLNHLEEELLTWRDRRRHLVICMSAASNVSGIITDTGAIASIAHKHGAVAVFEYETAGPYVEIDMNPSKVGYKDAVILSPHTFVGGPATPGVVIAKRSLFKNATPDRVGAGAIQFVTREVHGHSGNIEQREEGGTPAIIESIRAGMVFQVKQDVGTRLIDTRNEDLCRRAFKVWERNPLMHILGNHVTKRIPIFSFVTRHEQSGRLIHHNFIATLLNDLFGIQARGGCACAEPYMLDLMGVSEAVAKKYAINFLTDNLPGKDNSSPKAVFEIMRLGFTRINLPYFMDDETVDYTIRAVDLVTRYGWKLLSQYTFDIEDGSWRHKSFSNTLESELQNLVLPQSRGEQTRKAKDVKPVRGRFFKDVLDIAQEVFKKAQDTAKRSRISSASRELRDRLPREKRHMRWFLTPHEANTILADKERTYLDKNTHRLLFSLPPPVTRLPMDYHYMGDTLYNSELDDDTEDSLDDDPTLSDASDEPIENMDYRPNKAFEYRLQANRDFDAKVLEKQDPFSFQKNSFEPNKSPDPVRKTHGVREWIEDNDTKGSLKEKKRSKKKKKTGGSV